MIQIRNVYFQALTVVSHDVYVPTSLVALFHDLNILVEAFSLLVTDMTMVFREFAKVTKYEVNLNAYVTAMQLKGGIEFINYFHIIIWFYVPKKIVHHLNGYMSGTFFNYVH